MLKTYISIYILVNINNYVYYAFVYCQNVHKCTIYNYKHQQSHQYTICNCEEVTSLCMWGAGSQYCCWNSDSTLVAVSSDHYQAVMVFNVQSKQQVG